MLRFVYIINVALAVSGSIFKGKKILGSVGACHDKKFPFRHKSDKLGEGATFSLEGKLKILSAWQQVL